MCYTQLLYGGIKMLVNIQRAVEKIINSFSLSLDLFTEQAEKIFKNAVKINLNDFIEWPPFFEALVYLGSAVNITLRANTIFRISGDFNSQNKIDFEEWIQQFRNREIQISITIDKSEIVHKFFGKKFSSQMKIFFKPNYLLSALQLNNIENCIFNNEKFQIILAPFWNIESISNDYLMILGGKFVNTTPIPNYICDNQNLKSNHTNSSKLFKFYCNSRITLDRLTPDHVYFINQNNLNDHYGIMKELNVLVFKLVFHFIANISDEEQFILRGEREVRIKNDLSKKDIPFQEVNTFFNIYYSIYSVQTQDKILIARNVLTLYLEDDCFLDSVIINMSKIFRAFDSNVDSYVKDKVKSFFEKKKDLEKYVRDTSEILSKQISSVSDNMMKNWLGLIGAILGGAVTYLAKTNPILIFSFFMLFGILNFLILLSQIRIVKNERILILNSFVHFLKHVDGINDERKKELVGSIIEDKNKLLGKVINWFWTSMIITTVLSIIFAFGSLLFLQTNAQEENYKGKIINVTDSVYEKNK